MGKYAEGTTTSVAKSKEEIERIINRYDGDMVSFGWGDERTVVLGFRYDGKFFVRLQITLPHPSEFTRDARGYIMAAKTQEARYQQEVRRRYRVLKLLVTSKLELVEEGAETFEQAFMPYTLLPNGRTVYEAFQEQIDQSYLTGAMPRFLLPAPEGK